MAQRNFARGEPPPAHSWEWAGVAKPPETPQARPPAKPTPVVLAVSETIVVAKKHARPWLWIAAGAIGGYLLGKEAGRHGL